MITKKHCAFYVEHAYYWPQYAPVVEVLLARGCHVSILCSNDGIKQSLPDALQIHAHPDINNHIVVQRWCAEHRPDWLIAGNGVSTLSELAEGINTAVMMHDTDVSFKRASKVPSLRGFDVRFVGSPGRMQSLQSDYPDTKMVDTGYAKLAPLFPLASQSKANDKSVVLYTPTFYPSSVENMPAEWPAHFSDVDIIIKPHQFYLTKSKFESHYKQLQAWAKYPNVSLVNDMSAGLLPLMLKADIMISDASSATFEFASLDKPVLLTDFPKLRWSYSGPLKFRYRKRMAANTPEEAQLFDIVKSPKQFVPTLKTMLRTGVDGNDAERQRLVTSAVGERDGKAAERVADYLLAN